MRSPHSKVRTVRSPRARAVVAAAALLAGAFAACVPVPASAQGGSGPVVAFKDRLWIGVDGVFDGLVETTTDTLWISTTGGVVKVNPSRETRKLFTGANGLPDTVSYGLAAGDGKVWVGTDGGVAEFDAASSAVTRTWTPGNAPFRVNVSISVALDGEHLWIGTQAGGFTRLHLATGEHRAFNTSVGGNRPVRAIVPAATEILVATDGHGLLRLDRATETLSRVSTEEGLPTKGVLGVAERDGLLWLATDKGLVRYDGARASPDGRVRVWAKADGLPEDRVTDVEVRGGKVWASTQSGAAILDVPTGTFSFFDTRAGLRSNFIYHLASAGDEVLFATTRGLTSWNERTTELRHYTTRNGPEGVSFWGAGFEGGNLWLATDRGVSVLRSEGAWESLGVRDGIEADALPFFSVVPDPAHGHVWFASQKGVWGWNGGKQQWLWLTDKTKDVGNQYLNVGSDGGTLWLPEYGYALIEYDKRTGDYSRYTVLDGLYDWFLTDAKVVGGAVWALSASILHKMETIAGKKQFTAFYHRDNGGLDSRIMKRLTVDGSDLWISTFDAGVLRFSTTQSAVTRVYNVSTLKGFPTNDVRDALRDGEHLWLATGAGLVRVKLSGGDPVVIDRDDGLPTSIVRSLAVRDGILYAGTTAGVVRIDTSTLEVLPAQDGPTSDGDPTPPVVPGSSTGGPRPSARFPVSVQISSPESGLAVAGRVEVTGTASDPSGDVDRVEVRVDEGPWTNASGTEEWAWDWESASVTPGEHRLTARAIASDGRVSSEDVVYLHVIEPPKVPLTIRHNPRDSAFAGAPYPVSARATGDEPLSVTLFWSREGAPSLQRVELKRSGELFTGEIPASGMTEGTIVYLLEARSGLLKATAPADRSHPYRLTVAPPPPTGASLTGPLSVEASAGATVAITLTLANHAAEARDLRLSVGGPRAHWVTVPAGPHRVEAGQSVQVQATVAVPGDAYSDNVTLTFSASPAQGPGQPVGLDVPFRIEANPRVATAPVPATPRERFLGIPAPELALLSSVVALAAILLSRRRES